MMTPTIVMMMAANTKVGVAEIEGGGITVTVNQVTEVVAIGSIVNTGSTEGKGVMMMGVAVNIVTIQDVLVKNIGSIVAIVTERGMIQVVGVTAAVIEADGTVKRRTRNIAEGAIGLTVTIPSVAKVNTTKMEIKLKRRRNIAVTTEGGGKEKKVMTTLTEVTLMTTLALMTVANAKGADGDERRINTKNDIADTIPIIATTAMEANRVSVNLPQ